MMREILFRGKRTDIGLWVFGDVIQYADGTKAIKRSMLQSIVEVAPATVGQFTGLTDRNGKKIFEGDILQNEEGCLFGASYRFRVEFCKGCFYGDSCGDLTVCSPEMYLCEVIGNIHDNPELLEVEE